ncbi:MAG: hypothetical protein ACT4PV_16115 [Planctomycetaceae bacterium]
MARSLLETVAEIRELLTKDKVKAARKALEKAVKAGTRGPQLTEAAFELTLAEGGGAPAAEALRELADAGGARLTNGLKGAGAHLARTAQDHALRDVAWEMALVAGQHAAAVEHLDALLKAQAVDAPKRARSMLERKDEVGALGLFLMASLGGVKTDRVVLAKRLMKSESGRALLADLCAALRDAGKADAPVSFVLAQVAHGKGDKETFLQMSAAAAQDLRDEVLTWTGSIGSDEKLQLALRLESVVDALEAAGSMKNEELVAAASRVQGDGTTGRAIRGVAALAQGKGGNACRILEEVVRREKAAAEPLVKFVSGKAGSWNSAREAWATLVVEAGWGAAELAAPANALVAAPKDQRGESWRRSAARLLDRLPERVDLREAYGLALLDAGEGEEAAKLVQSADHLPAVRAWAEAGQRSPEVLRAAAGIVDRSGIAADHAEWLLKAARADATLLAEIGRLLSGSTVSAATALKGAGALLEQGQKEEAASFLARIPLDRDSGTRIDQLLKEKNLLNDRAFTVANFRAGLSLGDGPRAKRLYKAAGLPAGALVGEAASHADAARLLAEILIENDAPAEAVRLLDARRSAGDAPRTLLPLADSLLRGPSGLPAARLLRGRLLHAVKRDADAVRDLRTVPADAKEVDGAFEILGELAKGEAGGAAVLGRTDIHLAKKAYDSAILELSICAAPAAERLERYDAIVRQRPSLDAAHQGRAECLFELGRIPESADASFKRFACSDADPSAVADFLEKVAGGALKSGDLATAGSILERLPEQVSDGADRALRVIGSDTRAAMLILRSKLLLQLERTDEAVSALDALVEADPTSRAKCAEALAAIVDSGQARPEADFSLAHAFRAMEQTGRALASLKRLYQDDITAKANVVKALEELLLHDNDADVRLFLAQIHLDMREARGATEQAIQARRLRPASRREAVEVLRRALDLDAFSPDTHFALAEAHLAGDEADDAVRHFRAAVEVDRGRAAAAVRAMEEGAPRSAHPALLWLAVGTTCAEFQRDYKSAVKSFTNGLEAKPPAELRVPLLLGRGDAYAAQREDDSAFDDFDEASRLDLLERRYYEFLRSRQRKRVLAAAEESRKRAGEDFAAAVDACARFMRLNKPQDAVGIAQRAMALHPDSMGARYLVGVALHAAGRYDAAARALESVRSGAGADLELGRAARMLLAESYLDKGDRDSARACLTEIEAVDADYPGLSAHRAALAPPADDPHAPPPLLVRPEFPRPSE